MKVVIVEDETAAARNLAAMVKRVLPEAEIVATLESVEETVEWFGATRPGDRPQGGSDRAREDGDHPQGGSDRARGEGIHPQGAGGHPQPDLLLMDIHLADGESFRVFDRVEIACPIIFTTAYDRYALEAFKVNSIDYLLKPVKEDELARAVEKLRRLSGAELAHRRENIAEMAHGDSGQKIFLIHQRDKMVPLRVEQIAFLYTTDERVRAVDMEGNPWPMDRSLDKLQKSLSESDFFRANRQFVVARDAIADISVWFGSRLALNLKVKTPERIVISKDRVPEFKRWFMGV
ncbi:MAG: LytTR family DNA-binding domain-containing protein [Alistipes sp.]|jgi:DNA-binding LytR/AlgR family response regulator|nr:LytTR family DNA-binding domain-containing protein [Alistipes sp.]